MNTKRLHKDMKLAERLPISGTPAPIWIHFNEDKVPIGYIKVLKEYFDKNKPDLQDEG